MNYADRKTAMLRKIAQAPRTLKDFTNGTLINTVIAPRHQLRYLQDLVAQGLIEVQADVYSITPAGRLELSEPPVIVPGRIHTAASTKGTYDGPAWNIRAGGEDHLKHRSLLGRGDTA